MVSYERESAIIALLDDPSPIVQHALVEELRRLDDAGLSLLRKVRREDDRARAAAAARLLQTLQGPDPVAETTAFIRSLQYDLESGMLLFNRVLQPDLDTAWVRRQLDLMATRASTLMGTEATSAGRCKAINRVLFHEFGLHANSDDGDDPLNTLLMPVLRRRKGGALSLGITYILVAIRCGLDLEPLILPDGFLVGCFSDQQPFFINPALRGRFHGLEDMRLRLEANNPPLGPQYLAPLPVGEVLRLVCHTLARQFIARNNPRHARIFAGFVREFEDTYRRHSEA